MTKEEKNTACQVIVLLSVLKKETKKQYLKNEIDRLIRKMEKSVN